MAEKINPISIEESVLALRDASAFVCSRLINREDVVEQTFYALLTGEHILLQSRTGVGKSLMAEQIFAVFEGANLFKVQASKEQQPDTYFGGLDIEKLKVGKILHNTEGSLVESEFGFIDEIFDANDFTLRALLSLLNERALIRGVQYVKAKTHTVIAATNYLRVSEVTEAILDRFLFKAIILPDKNPFLQYQISQQYLEHSGNIKKPTKKIQFSTLQHLYNVISGDVAGQEISISPELLYFTNLVVRHYEYARNRHLRENNKTYQGSQEFYISPRTQAKSLDLLRAVALMNGRQAVEFDDVHKLGMIFTTLGSEDEKQLFTKSFTTTMNTLSVSNGFEQLKVLLGFAALLGQIKADRSLLSKPLSDLDTSPLRRSLFEWIKEMMNGTDQSLEQNKRALKSFVQEFIPVCEEIRELKLNLTAELDKVLK